MFTADDRFTPLALSPRLKTKNRVVVPAMASETADAEGYATQATVGRYRRLAEAGAGMVMVEYTYVHRSGRSEPNQLGADKEAHTEGLERVAGVIRAAGSVPGLQLTHAGGKTERRYTDGRIMGPSGIAVPVKDRLLEAPGAMDAADIVLWRDSFVAAAARGVAAGFELIELHAAHGYGLNQWLSPLTNTRTDAYGGTLANRARLLIEIVTAIKTLFPDLVISVRVPGQDHLPGGLTTGESIRMAKLLVAAGAGLINVSSGLGGWRRPGDRSGEGYLVAEAAAFQAQLTVPVIGVGGIETGAFIDASLSKRSFALAAVGRAILADPVEWGRRQLVAVPTEDQVRDIKVTVQRYLDGFLAQEASLLRRAFHQHSQLMAVDGGEVSASTTAGWFERIEKRRADGGGALTGSASIIGVDHVESAAVVKVSIALPAYTFTDYLSLLKTVSGWQIVNKIYEARDNA